MTVCMGEKKSCVVHDSVCAHMLKAVGKNHPHNKDYKHTATKIDPVGMTLGT